MTTAAPIIRRVCQFTGQIADLPESPSASPTDAEDEPAAVNPPAAAGHHQ
ncbi:hypothetical protein [Mycolicibacterium sp. XJ1819]